MVCARWGVEQVLELHELKSMAVDTPTFSISCTNDKAGDSITGQYFFHGHCSGKPCWHAKNCKKGPMYLFYVPDFKCWRIASILGGSSCVCFLNDESGLSPESSNWTHVTGGAIDPPVEMTKGSANVTLRDTLTEFLRVRWGVLALHAHTKSIRPAPTQAAPPTFHDAHR